MRTRLQEMIRMVDIVGLQDLYQVQCDVVEAKSHEEDWDNLEHQYREHEFQLNELKMIKAYALLIGFELKRAYNDPT